MGTNARRALSSYTASRPWNDAYQPIRPQGQSRSKRDKANHHPLPEWQVSEVERYSYAEPRSKSIFPSFAYIILAVVCFAHSLFNIKENAVGALPLFILSVGLLLYGFGRLVERKFYD